MNQLSILSCSNKRHDEFILKLFGLKDVETKNTLSIINHEIKTKYYTSTVNVYWIGIHEEEFKNHEEIILKSQSCVLMVESFEEFNSLKKYFYDLLSKSKYFDSSTFMVIETQFEEKEMETMKEWCLEEGLEFVDIHEEPTEEKVERRNKVGIDRLHEVLECTIWPERSEPKKVEIKPIKEEEKLVENFDENYFKNLVQQVEQNDPSSKDEFDLEMTQMDSLFQEMLNLKMNGGSMDHEVRKEKAAKLAMTLFTMMEAQEEEEEEE
jgi:hypothetical protein